MLAERDLEDVVAGHLDRRAARAASVYGGRAASSEPIGGPAGPGSDASPKTNVRRSRGRAGRDLHVDAAGPTAGSRVCRQVAGHAAAADGDADGRPAAAR